MFNNMPLSLLQELCIWHTFDEYFFSLLFTDTMIGVEKG